jgi:HTH-type transcriptional regulator/antitoxin HigA
MALKTGKLSDTYFELVRAFPLTHIRDEVHLAEAQAVIDRLLRQDLDAGGQEYLDVLTDLVEDYEDEHVEVPEVDEADVLRELMRGHGLTQTRLSEAVGIAQSTLSAVLNGTRSLTKGQVVKLAKFFAVHPSAFLPD